MFSVNCCHFEINSYNECMQPCMHIKFAGLDQNPMPYVPGLHFFATFYLFVWALRWHGIFNFGADMNTEQAGKYVELLESN